VVDAIVSTSYAYDGMGHVLSEKGPWASDQVSYTYTNGLRASLSLQIPGGPVWTNGLAYDGARRLKTLTTPAGAYGCTYDPVRKLQVATLNLPNNSYIANTYDPVARLSYTALQNSPSAILNSHTYIYNLAGQRFQQTFTAGNYTTYTYDNSGQLKTAQGVEPGGSPRRLMEQLGYVYDPAGNLTNRSNNALSETFVVNAANELSGSAPSGTITVAGGTTPLATNVAVNGINTAPYHDSTFAVGGFTRNNGNNSFTAVATDASGRQATTADSE